MQFHVSTPGLTRHSSPYLPISAGPAKRIMSGFNVIKDETIAIPYFLTLCIVNYFESVQLGRVLV